MYRLSCLILTFDREYPNVPINSFCPFLLYLQCSWSICAFSREIMGFRVGQSISVFLKLYITQDFILPPPFSPKPPLKGDLLTLSMCSATILFKTGKNDILASQGSWLGGSIYFRTTLTKPYLRIV